MENYTVTQKGALEVLIGLSSLLKYLMRNGSEAERKVALQVYDHVSEQLKMRHVEGGK